MEKKVGHNVILFKSQRYFSNFPYKKIQNLLWGGPWLTQAQEWLRHNVKRNKL